MNAINNVVEYVSSLFRRKQGEVEHAVDIPAIAKPIRNIKTLTQCYLDRPIDNNWYELLPLYMRVTNNFYQENPDSERQIHFDFYSNEDRSVTPSDLDNILQVVNSLIEKYTPEPAQEYYKQVYRQLATNPESKSHLKLARVTAHFCSGLLLQD